MKLLENFNTISNLFEQHINSIVKDDKVKRNESQSSFEGVVDNSFSYVNSTAQSYKTSQDFIKDLEETLTVIKSIEEYALTFKQYNISIEIFISNDYEIFIRSKSIDSILNDEIINNLTNSFKGIKKFDL